MKMSVLRTVAASTTTIMGLMITCEGQYMMRKRLVSPTTLEIEDFVTASHLERRPSDIHRTGENPEQHNNRQLGGTGGHDKDGKYLKKKSVHHLKSVKKSLKGDKSFKGHKSSKKGGGPGKKSKVQKRRETMWDDYDYTSVIRMDMSIPNISPTRKPSDSSGTNPKPAPPTPKPASPTRNPTKAPASVPKTTSLPTEAAGCQSLPRDDVLKKAAETVTDSSVLNDPTTPQGKALAWLQGSDPAQIDPCNYPSVEQRYALATFYYSTQGGSWENSDGWMQESNECSWFGIKCNGDGRVDELGADGALIGNELSGVLPQELKVLESLETIEVGQNAIGGSIPDILFELTELRIFDVEINSLSGPAIVNLRGLDRLESYRVSANRLSGKLDPNIGDVKSLRELWMADNQISGTIPESFGSLVNMETLYMYRNNLVGSLPATFGQMGSLREIQIFQNFLSGTIPEGLYSNTELGLVRLDRNQFTGTISESIGKLVNLKDLRIDENLFTGILPASFSNLSKLEVLRVNDNNFVGTIRDGFDMWNGLDFADFRNNGFEGTLPGSIFEIPTIRILYFANNNLEGTIPSSYGSSGVLRDLFLSGNQLTGTIPDIQVGQLTQLTELLLEDNKFTGTMTESVCNLRASGQGMLEDLWVDCGVTADPRLECDAPACCTACFPSSRP